MARTFDDFRPCALSGIRGLDGEFSRHRLVAAAMDEQCRTCQFLDPRKVIDVHSPGADLKTITIAEEVPTMLSLGLVLCEVGRRKTVNVILGDVLRVRQPISGELCQRLRRLQSGQCPRHWCPER